MNPYNNPFPGHDREPDPLRTRRGVETAAKVIRSAVNVWLDDKTPELVHLQLVLDEIGPVFHTARVLDIAVHTLDEHPDYQRLATGSRPLLVDGETYAWCVWERDVDEDAHAALPAPVLGAVA